ncbi:hypothetical protein, partial [Escherichia coli]|uniref:hypothetical protein n=1 Tax=Escherichia coli TaxID=562 RepID=UPI0026719F30
MDLEGIKLSEISQRGKVKYHMISLIRNIKTMTKKTHSNRDWVGDYQRGRREGRGLKGWLGTHV